MNGTAPAVTGAVFFSTTFHAGYEVNFGKVRLRFHFLSLTVYLALLHLGAMQTTLQ
jgi:hypothetical protein